MNPRNFFAELKRRNVYKVAVAYAVVAWLLIQAASIMFPTFDAPPWVMKVFIAAILSGFPIALILAWAFELTPEGIVPTEEVAPNESITHQTGRKLITTTIVVALIASALLAWQFLRPRAATTVPSATTSTAAPVNPAAPEKSIAVLPFDNLSRDPENAYFAEGIQEEILTRLAKVADLKVISRGSTQRLKSAPDNLPVIAKMLGVTNILEGSVQKSADQVRVNVQLINAMTDAHLWADTYDRKLTDIFAVESEIAKAIAETLRAKLTGPEQHALSSRPTENAEAHRFYLKGRYYWNQRSEKGFKKAIEYFKQAIDADPNYALAYAGIADSYVLLGFHGYGAMAPREAYPKAKVAAEKALQIDETLGEAHAALANVRENYDWDLVGAEKEYKRAIELNPKYATAHQWYGSHLAVTERYPEAMAQIKQAQELDPLSLIINVNVSWFFYFARQYDDALEQGRKTLDLEPNFAATHWMLGQAYRQKGMYAEAIAEFQMEVVSRSDPLDTAVLGHAYAVAGKRAEAEKILKELTALSKERYVSPYFIALIYVGLNDKKEAFDWLEKAFADRSAGMVYLKVEPMFDALRADPRFEALVAKVFAPKNAQVPN